MSLRQLFSFLHPKSEMDAVVSVDGEELQYQAPVPTQQQQEVEQTGAGLFNF